jgi:predicted GTPase
MKEQISDIVQTLEELLENSPVPLTKSTKEKIKVLREMLLQQRPPRFALVGRRGSGKSSLINAFFGEYVAEVGHEKAQTGKAKWWHYKGEIGEVEVLDSRGFQEGSKPDEADLAQDPFESISTAIELKSPDAILFLIKAKDVDSGVDTDLMDLQKIGGFVNDTHKFFPPILAIITHCDELEPKNTKLHISDSDDEEEYNEKIKRVSALEKLLTDKITAIPVLKDHLISRVLGVSSYQSWKRDKTKRDDERWRIDKLIKYLSNELPNEAQIELARVSQLKNLQEEISLTLTHTSAAICSGIAAIPVPIADIVPITSVQISLISGIAYTAGRQLSFELACEFLAALGFNLGAGFTLREISRALWKWLLPGGGSIISASVAYAGTYAIGKAAIAHFIFDTPKEKLSEIYEKAKFST